MRRGIDNRTALSTRHQFLSILSEGTRMSRKNSRLQHFLASFCPYIIDFIITHNSLANRRLLHTHFAHAVWNTANNHLKTWGMTGSQLWVHVFRQIVSRLKTENYHPSIRRLVLSTLSANQPNFKRPPSPNDQQPHMYPTELSQPKRRRLNPPSTDQQFSNHNGEVSLYPDCKKMPSQQATDESTENLSGEFPVNLETKLSEAPSDYSTIIG